MQAGLESALSGSFQPADQPLEIAPRIWWVGHRQENDPFQCHVYLIEQGDQSILIDPGSNRTIEHTLKKIAQIIPFSKIRYFVCQHQDPDISAALPLLDSMVTRTDAAVVTHWRAEALLKHYALKMPFWLIDQHDWRLPLEDRTLEFVFTPYAHFPGAFCTFDPSSGVLFSSDLYGGFSPVFTLVARDLSVFDGMRTFHEHYMPSREILGHALNQLMQKPVKIIAPQHGSIIPEALVRPITDKLAALECGLYLLAGEYSDIERLSRLSDTLRGIVQTMVLYREFREVATRLLTLCQRVIPATSLEFLASVEEGRLLQLSPRHRYRGRLIPTPKAFDGWFGMHREEWMARHRRPFTEILGPEESRTLAIPLFDPENARLNALALFQLSQELELSADVLHVVDQMALPLGVAVERERIYRSIELEKERLFQKSIRDPLTGMFTRLYMNDVVQHLFDVHDRDEENLGVLMCDIDHFKSINDTYGHAQGDVVLARVASEIRAAVRRADLAVRLGGEEFGVFVIGKHVPHLEVLAERVRTQVEAIRFEGVLAERQVTVSVGAAIRKHREALPDLLSRADAALYEAKNGGRNRVCMFH